MLQGKILRVARPTDQLDEVVRFYTDGLGLQILFSDDQRQRF
jgi:catechol 2,3-dioxygenase-like lactoylglutathione lyase family enzyme